ncbi:helicase HerA domain-containing protein [Lichenibacterium dinghuense]|uniref:helicase HerA domain-containing protein n=1 Tax=Lichenibacterium dinghuense TaxID=2895977 RepID=UPI001F329641|nr:DUF87 domain-containing protein [Lichenibacterium sp. 6Y81]
MTTRALARAHRTAPADLDAAALDGEVAVRPAPVKVGRGDTGDAIELTLGALLDGRLLIQGMSGAGKSWLLRRLLETTALAIQQVVLDPEGEFGSLAERYGHVHLDAARLDPEALAEAAGQARVLQLSLWVDLSQLERGPQMAAVAAVLRALVLAGPDHWHPCLVTVDEAHLFAPQAGGAGASRQERRASLEAVADLMGRGRKRGLCGVLATQRLVNLAKSVASEAGNVLIGRNALELDIARAAQAIGWTRDKAEGHLPHLRPGSFIAVGTAFSRSPVVVHVGPVVTRHRGSTPRLSLPPPRGGDGAAMLDVEDLASATASRLAALRSGCLPAEATAVRRFMREPGAAAAALAYDELWRIRPLPRLVSGLARQLGLGAAAVEVALSLLDGYGLVRRGQGADGPTVEAI